MRTTTDVRQKHIVLLASKMDLDAAVMVTFAINRCCDSDDSLRPHGAKRVGA